MKSFQLSHPTRVIFGRNTIQQIGQQTRQYGKHALIVIKGNSIKKTGLLELVFNNLKSVGVTYTVFTTSQSEPTFSDINEGASFAKKEKIDVVIGLGGGSAIDSAKAIAACVKNKSSIEKLITGIDFTALPIIAIPTTAGTGSELSKGAILTDEKNQVKTGLRSENLIPKVAIVDPELTLSLPPSTTALSGFDALAHAIESLLSIKANNYTRMLSLEAIREIYTFLPQAFENGQNSEAREHMSYASMLMGYNLVYASTGLPHRIQYAFGTLPRMTHATGLAILYPSWLKLAVNVAPNEMMMIAKAIDIPRSQLRLNKWKGQLLDKILTLRMRIGLNTRLRDFGVGRKDILRLTNKVTGNVEMYPVYKGKKTIQTILSESL